MEKFYQFCLLIGRHLLTGLGYGIVISVVLLVLAPVITFIIGHVCLLITAVTMSFGAYDLYNLEVIWDIGIATAIIDAVVLPIAIVVILPTLSFVFKHVPDKAQEKV